MAGQFPETNDKDVAKLFIAWSMCQKVAFTGDTHEERIESQVKLFEQAYRGVKEATKSQLGPSGLLDS